MPGKTMTHQPFIYGRPVRPSEFLDREAELRAVFNRLRNCESSAIVGEPHIGKSSLLLQVADEATQQAYLGQDAQCMVVSSQDLHSIGTDYTPVTFWKEVLEPLRERPGNRAMSQHLEQTSGADYSRRSLEKLFGYLDKRNQRLVLLLDEFERLLFHPNFQDPAFLALLRSLATRTGGLALLIASRFSVTEMNEQGQGLLEPGSPFFNYLIEVRVRPFDEQTVDMLLDQAEDVLSIDDRRFIRRVAGRHPFLLQAMAATLLETTGNDRHAYASERFYERISFHFDDLWRSLDDRTRTTAVVLGLMELGGRALGKSFSYGEIENAAAFGPELWKLAERGLAERVSEGWRFDHKHLLLWRGEQWTVGTQAFAWWVRDVIIARTREVPAYEEWLTNRRYRFLLTQEQWDRLVSAVRNAPGGIIRGAGALARSLFEELTKNR